MGEPAIRLAVMEDIPAVLELWQRARSAAAVTPDDEDTVARLLATDPRSLLLAERDGEIVGTLIAAWDGWRGNMYRLAVLPEHRRQGHATRLVQAGHEALLARGARRVTALVADDEEHATALWRAAGYQRDAHIGRFVRNL